MSPLNRKFRWIVTVSLLTAWAGSGSGCMSFTKRTPAATPTAPAATEAPYVEGYLEYPGPPDRWAGPQSLVVHLIARDPASSRVILSPSVFNPESPLLANNPQLPAYEHVVHDIARTELADLASAAKGSLDGAGFAGCMYPVRLRLVRADGSVFERRGCRGQTGWPVAMSRITSQTIQTALNERQKGEPNRTLSASSKGSVNGSAEHR